MSEQDTPREARTTRHEPNTEHCPEAHGGAGVHDRGSVEPARGVGREVASKPGVVPTPFEALRECLQARFTSRPRHRARLRRLIAETQRDWSPPLPVAQGLRECAEIIAKRVTACEFTHDGMQTPPSINEEGLSPPSGGSDVKPPPEIWWCRDLIERASRRTSTRCWQDNVVCKRPCA